MKNYLRSLYLLSLAIISTLTINQTRAQLVVSAPPAGPNYTQLVQQFFVGGGVTVSNVTYTGAANAVGSFTNANTNLGLAGGIILSTGNRNTAIGPNNAAGAGTNLNLAGFAQLNGLAGATTYDGTMLQFDFIAQSSTVTFQYIFASEEYPEYVNAGYNDAFAFFIQGPGFPTWSNIALVPGTTTPITIDNVNSNSYSQYYVNNAGGQTIQFDGFTTTMTATATVVPCQTYTLRLMIADAGDHIYDSAVFLGQGSLSSNAVTVSAGSGYSGSTNTAYEGCLPGYLNFAIPQAQSTPFTFNYTIGGTAQNGVDYQTIPTSVTIPAGQTSAQIVINANNDNITEGQESIDVTVVNLCSTSTTTVYINDVAPLTVNAGADQTLCTNTPSATLNATITGGLQPYTYAWSNGPTTAGQTVTPAFGANNYTVTVTDACPHTATDQVTVTANQVPTATFTLSAATACTGTNATVTYTGTPIAGQTYTWNFNGGTVVSGSGAGPYQISWATAGSKTVSLTVNNNGCTATASQNITINQTPTAAFTVSGSSICDGQAATASATTVAGGTYNWTVNNGATINGSGANVGISYPGPGTYTVSLSVTANGCTSATTATNTITVKPQPTANFTATSPVCTGVNGTVTYSGTPLNGASFTWGFNGGTVASGAGAGPYNINWATAGTKNVTLTVALNGCSASSTVPVVVNQTPVAAFTVSGSSICNGQAATASATTVAGGTYNWTVNNGATINGSGANVGISYPGPGTYTVSLSVTANGCTSATTATNTITVKPQPTANFTATSPVCTGVNGTVTYSGTPLNGATYTWGFNGGTASGNGAGPYSVNWATAGAKTVTLTVALNGCSASSSVPVTVNQTPTAAFTVSGSSICDGQVVTATATTVAGATYNWSVNNGATISGNGAGPVTVNYAGVGSYTVSLSTTANGCTSATTATNTITVKPQPTATFTAASPVCTGVNGAITYTGTPLTGATYTWGFNGGTVSSGSGAGPYAINWATAGTKNVTLTVALNGCSASSTVPVTVNQTPSATFTASSPLCTGVNGTVTYSGTPINGAAYNWNFDGANVVSGANQGPYTVNWATAGVKNVTLTVTSNGCSASSAIVPVTVKQTPTSTFTADSPLCVGQAGNVSYVGTPIPGAAYTWNFNGGNALSGSGVGPYQVSWATAGTKNVTLNVSLNGCSSGVTTIPVVVNPTPTAAFTLSGSTICDGQLLSATYNGSASNGATYNWAINNGGTVVGSGAGPITFIYPGAGTYTVSLAVTQNGCSSATNNVTVTVKPKPTSSFTTTSPLCTGVSGAITYTGTPISGASYVWNFNGGTVVSGAGMGPYQVNWTTPGTKTVTLSVSANGCASGSGTQQVVVNQTPSATFTAPSTLCSGANGTITYTGAQLNGATYTWNFDSANVVGSGVGPFQVNWPVGGVHPVTLSVTANGCTNSSAANINVNTTPVSSFTVSNTQFCTGAAATITYNGTPVTGATYTWNFNGGTVISGSGMGPYNVSWATPGSKNITLNVTANGCSSGTTIVPIIINAIPTSSFTASANSVCDGAPVTLNYTGNGNGSATFNWSSTNGGTIGGNSSPFSFSYPSDGTYNVSLTVTQNGCTSAATNLAITVKPVPVADFDINNTQFCAGANATVTYTGTVISGAIYAWNFNGGTVANGSGAGPYNVNWASAGNKTVSLTVTAAGCASAPVSEQVMVYQVPTSTFTASAPAVCDGAIVGINYSGNASSNATYNWTVNNNGSITGAPGSFALDYPTPATYNISLSVSENGCSSTTTTVPVTVHPIPTSDFSVSNAQVCKNANTVFSYTGTPISGATYTWNFNGGTVVNGNGMGPYNVNWATPGTKNISLTVTANGCPSATSTVQVVVNDIPTPTYTLSGNPVCDGTPVDITYNGTGTSNATYNWSVNNGGVIVDNGNDSYTLNYPGPATYNLSLTVTENGCTSAPLLQSVVVKPMPNAAFNASTPICTNDINIITYTGGAPTNSTYAWNFDGGTVVSGSGAGPYNVKWAAGGTKNLTLTVTQNGCTSPIYNKPVVVNDRPTSAFVVSSAAVCMGQPVNMTYTGTGSPNATFNWSVSNGASIDTTGGQVALNYSSPGNYNISLNVTENGCSSPSTTTVPVTVNLMPTSVFTASASPICTGDTLHLTYSGNASPNATYTWNAPGLNITSAGNNQYNVNYSNAGNYNISLTVTQNGCTSASSNIPVVINQTPTTAFALSSNSVCNGQPVSIQYNGNASSSATYNWSVNNGANIVFAGLNTFDVDYPGIGTYNVSLSVTDNGCTSTNPSNTASFTVHEVPVSAFVATNSPICEGEPLTLNYTGNQIPGAVYTWYTPANVYVNASGLTSYDVDYPSDGTFDIALRVTANGCSSDTTQVPLVVKPTPDAPFSATPNVCVGIDGYITFNGVTNPDYIYNWDFDGGVVTAGSNQGPYVVNWGSAGTKDLTLIVTLNGCSSDTAHFSVDVNTTPVSDFSASSPLCTGVDGTIFYTGNAITGAVYTWNFDGASVSSGSGMGPYEVNWTTPGPKLLSLVVDANGCTSTVTQQAVIVNETPTAQFSALDTNVCLGEPITLIYGGNASAAATYNWFVTGGASVSGANSGPFTLEYPSAGTYYLTLTVTENGCASQNPMTIPVVITPLPQAYFTSPIGECLSSNSYDFLAQGTFTNSASFSWGFPGSNSIASSSLINPSGVSYGTPGIYLVSLSVSDLGCNSAFIDTVKVYPDPVVAFSSDVFRGCEDFQVQFAENSGYGSDAGYLWNFGDGNSSSDPNPIHTYDTPGTYTVSLQISFSAACGGTYTNSAMITVYPKPEAGFSATPMLTDMLNPTVTITNNAIDITACVYDMADGTIIDSILNPSHTYQNPGNYVVTQYVTNSFGCTDTAWMQLRIDPYNTLYIPNAFTPNNDGKNDSFGAKGIMVNNFKMYIFNRWGELIFIGNNIDEYWDGIDKTGKVSPQDVYVYKIFYTLPDGSEQKQIGSVALVD